MGTTTDQERSGLHNREKSPGWHGRLESTQTRGRLIFPMAVEDTFSSRPPIQARAASSTGSQGVAVPENVEEEATPPSSHKHTGLNVAGKVKIGPPPDWVKIREVDHDFQPDMLGASTCLLWDRQDHAEKSQQYHRVVSRLETLQAVHDFARQRIHFDPNTQQLIVHSIAIVRDGQRVEQAELGRFHFAQRGIALENSVINGWTTLLLELESVRQGDVVDASYTVISTPKIMPGRFCRFYSLPFGIPARALHIVVHFAPTRSLNWKSSSKDFKPVSTQEDGESHLEWKRENLTAALPDPNLPAWFVAENWIQVTDCASWEEVVEACLKSWPFENTSPRIKELAESLCAGARTPEERADRLINHVQDTCRYLEVGPDAAGQAPTPSDDVLRRGYGGCKDLSLLLTLLLRAANLPARPVLVDNRMKKRVDELLPMPHALNHALVEFELGSERYWVDPANRLQGGGARNRAIQDYGLGLVLERGIKELRPMPNSSTHGGKCQTHEVFWMNSNGPWSILEVQITVTGAQADHYRNWFASQPESVIAREREMFYGKMFAQVKRVGGIERRDYRGRNEFIMAEMFEVAGILRPLGSGAYGFFTYPSHLIQSAIAHPPKEDRKTPFALPFPYSVEHAITVDLPGLQTGLMPPYNLRTPCFHLNRRSKFSVGVHTVIYSFETLVDSVPPDEIREFKKAADEVWYETTFNVEVPSGMQEHQPEPGTASARVAASAAPARRRPSSAFPPRPGPPLKYRPVWSWPARHAPPRNPPPSGHRSWSSIRRQGRWRSCPRHRLDQVSPDPDTSGSRRTCRHASRWRPNRCRWPSSPHAGSLRPH